MRARRAPRLSALVAAAALCAAAAGCSSSSGGSDARAAAPPLTGYAALGDSYSAGQGVGSYLAGTDTSGNSCHRSPRAYPELIDADHSLGVLTFAACSGASTADLVAADHQNNVDAATNTVLPPQISRVSPASKAVSLTIGGNDAGFSSVLAQCITGRIASITVFPHLFASPPHCATNTALHKTVDARLAALAGGRSARTADGSPIVSITELLARIHSRAPGARLYLVGYPALFGNPNKDCSVGGVSVAHVPLFGSVKVTAKLAAADVRWLNDVAHRLDGALRNGAAAAAHQGVPVTFVDVDPFFSGHRLCDSKPAWIAPVSGAANLATRSSSLSPSTFHPTLDGQRQGYAAALGAAGLH